MKSFLQRWKFPPLGQRIIKTSVAVFLCFLIYMLRGYRGRVGDAVVAAIICVQPYSKDSKKSAMNRVKGTVAGAVWGLLFLLVVALIPPIQSNMLVIYAIMALGIIPVLYTAVVFNLKDAASLAAIIYACIIVGYPNIESPLIQTFDRCFDTIVGVFIAIMVNNFHLPRQKKENLVFFVRLQDLVEDRFSKVKSRVLIELNRLYDDGAYICLESKWAPAFLMSQMGMLNINMPVIVMDGAIVYDIRENAFLDIVETPHDLADKLFAYFDSQNMGYCVFAMRGNTMSTFLEGNVSEAELEEMKIFRRSPYRNYMSGVIHSEDRIAIIRVLVRNEEADAFERRWNVSDLRDEFRMTRRKQPRNDAWTGFYFSNVDATIENMERRIVQHMENAQDKKVIRIRPESPYYYPQRDAAGLLQKIRNMYMPVHFPWSK